MAGFYAEASDMALQLNEELEEAVWLTPDELRERLEANRLRLPARLSIAFQVIRGWYRQHTGKDLQDLINRLKKRASEESGNS